MNGFIRTKHESLSVGGKDELCKVVQKVLEHAAFWLSVSGETEDARLVRAIGVSYGVAVHNGSESIKPRENSANDWARTRPKIAEVAKRLPRIVGPIIASLPEFLIVSSYYEKRPDASLYDLALNELEFLATQVWTYEQAAMAEQEEAERELADVAKDRYE